LGPVMAYHALRPYAEPNLDLRFVANVDPWDCAQALAGADPEQTLIVVSSKTFTTAETMANAQAARRWLIDALGSDAAVERHFVAVSTNADAVRAFGIDTANMFGFWDWVGGRYSMDSAIGLSTMLAIGPKQFEQLLAGFHAMDEHFRSAPFTANLPVIMGLLTVWYRNFFGAASVGVMPYEQRLSRFPAYLQQLTMESNGKRVMITGEPVPHATAPVLWGEPGTNGQHSFFQLLHQGTEVMPIDFIAFARCATPIGDQHDQLLANALAQAQALAFGRTADEVRAAGTPEWLVPHQVVPGNRPNSMILAAELTPYQLGTLVALYEHSVYVQSVIWGIDAFDQWGVELGKVLARSLVPAVLGGQPPATIDSSTKTLLQCLTDLRVSPRTSQ
ncbi:MAG: glucose-6-phosphate isomerase, partial [Actinomycetales bacterium]